MKETPGLPGWRRDCLSFPMEYGWIYHGHFSRVTHGKEEFTCINPRQALDPSSAAKQRGIIPSGFAGIVRLTIFPALRLKKLSLRNKRNT